MKSRDSRLCRRLFYSLLIPAALFAAGTPIELRTVSSRADMVSGGDVLIEAAGPGAASLREARARLNGRKVALRFQPAANGRMLARIEGLAIGSNRLELGKASLRMVNHPRNGPVFSGPHQKPFACQTEEAGLGKPLDADCSAAPVVAYYYKTTERVPSPGGRLPRGGVPPAFKPYDPAKPRPGDVAHTTTIDGRTVDFIVRRESGVINRAIYDFAVLHDPAQPGPEPWTPPAGWNGRLVYQFGGGCTAGYRQGLSPKALNESLLAKGFAVASSSQNVFGNNCNDVLSAETLMMVKERFIERIGIPVHTIGSGGSGGSMQQYLAVQNYPGLLDGITPGASYPDILTVANSTVDCALLSRAFEGSRLAWTSEQKAAVSGFATWGTCVSWNRGYSPGWLVAARCNSVPRELIYHPVTNPRGVRCSIYDNQVNVLGRNPRSGLARRPLDNLGVQYGLAAYRAGKITTDQFLDLNERVGGFDADGGLAPKRTAADPETIRIAYANGLVNMAGGGLASVPIVDHRTYMDLEGNIHDSYRSFVTRARLIAAHGSAGNHAIVMRPQGINAPNLDPIMTVNQWLDNVAHDPKPGTAAEKTARNKPAGLGDTCWTAEGEKVVEPRTYGGKGRCDQALSPHAGPRIAAGGPLTDDVLKCSLKSVSPADYPQNVSPAELERLRAIFPEGVCDYSRPGVGQYRPRTSWRTYR